MNRNVYLDHNASTPCDPRVVEEMVPLLTETYANPASKNHRMGQLAFSLFEEARRRLARAIGCRRSSQITFTSGATEANNLVLKGLPETIKERGRHLITQATEHPSVLEPLGHLQRRGWELSILDVDAHGLVRLDDLADALRPDTVLVSLMLANNESGAIQPVREAADIIDGHQALLHCDAVQGPGKLPIDVAQLGADLVTFSAHKAYGPKGIGVLYTGVTQPAIRLQPLLHGGGQELGSRSGTPNVPGAVGMARAMEIACAEQEADSERASRLRRFLEERILDSLPDCRINGPEHDRLPGTSNISFADVDGNALLASIPEIAVSSGSACSTSHPGPSTVLLAMGVPRRLAASSIRFSLGRWTTEDEVAYAADRVIEEVQRLRSMPGGRNR
jgi:cysteine desulfurase